MEKNRIFLLIVATFCVITLLLSTANRLTGVQSIAIGPAQRHASFAQIWVRSLGSAEECYSRDRLVDCLTTLHEDQIRIDQVVNGSSVVIHHDDRRRQTYVATAHHVCIDDELPQESVRVGRGGIPVGVRYLWSVHHELVDIDGRRRGAQIFHLDRDNDMCVLSTYDIWGQVAPLATRDPVLGETVYGVSAPEGLFSPHMVPIFSGIYSGRSTGRVPSFNGTGVMRSEIDVYTFNSRPGSSGSGVFNLAGELIGIVHSTVVNVNGVSIASTPRRLRDLCSVVRLKLQRYRH